MLAALIIVFREVFEAGLIVGIVLAVTGSVPHRNRWIGGGVLAGALAACIVAAFAGALSQLFAGMGQELFNAAILAVAVIMLTWHNVWMARHGREMAGEMRAVGQAVADGTTSLLALAVVVGVAVLREGSEVAAGTVLRSVRMAWASAEPHLQARDPGISATASATTRQAFSAFFTRLAMMSLTVTASCSGCQQS